MSTKKYAGNYRMTRTILNSIYGKKKGRPDAECIEKDLFAVATISGSGFDFRGRNPRFEYYEFHKHFNFKITPEVWNRLLEQQKSSSHPEDCWPVFEKRDDTVVVAWFEKSMLISEWVPAGQPCPFTKKLVPFKNGYFKSVPIEASRKRPADSSEDSPAKRQKIAVTNETPKRQNYKIVVSKSNTFAFDLN